MPNRHEWRFEYPGRVIAAAAKERTSYHRDRIEYWQKQKDAVDTEVETAQEDNLSAYSNTKRYMGNRADDCMTKILEHQTHIAKLNLYARACEQKPDKVFELDAEDVEWFGL